MRTRRADRGRLRGAAALVLVLLLVVLGVSVAAARPAGAAPAQDPPAAPAAGDPEAPPAVSPCAAGQDPEARMGVVLPDDCWGRFPASHYDIGCDEGAWNHVGRKVPCVLTDLAYQGGKAATVVSLWLVEWSYGFGIVDRLGPPALSIAESLEQNLIGPLGLADMAWFAVVAWAGFTALRGRMSMAAGELAMSMVLAMLTGVLMANPSGYLEGTFDTLGQLSGAMFAVANGEPPPRDAADTDEVLAPLQAQIQSAFIEHPYDYLNWGGPLTGACAERRDQILAEGPHGNDDFPRWMMGLGSENPLAEDDWDQLDERMQAEGSNCQAAAEFNHDPTGTRLFGAALMLLASLVLAVLVGMVSLTVVVAGAVAVFLFALAPFAALGAVPPAGGRRVFWSWLGALAQVFLAVVGMGAVLSLMLLAVQAMLAGTADAGMVERFMLVNLVVIVMFFARKRILAAGSAAAKGFADRMAQTRAGSGGSGAGGGGRWATAAAAGATGFGIGAAMGSDRARTMASGSWRNHKANSRMRKQNRRAEKRSRKPVSRERSELTVDENGEMVRSSSVTVDGAMPRSRRGRRARDKFENRAGKRNRRNERQRYGRPGSRRHARSFVDGSGGVPDRDGRSGEDVYVDVEA